MLVDLRNIQSARAFLKGLYPGVIPRYYERRPLNVWTIEKIL